MADDKGQKIELKDGTTIIIHNTNRITNVNRNSGGGSSGWGCLAFLVLGGIGALGKALGIGFWGALILLVFVAIGGYVLYDWSKAEKTKGGE